MAGRRRESLPVGLRDDRGGHHHRLGRPEPIRQVGYTVLQVAEFHHDEACFFSAQPYSVQPHGPSLDRWR